MRINVYSQELTCELALVSKTDERGNVHHGVRMFLASPAILHHPPDDDDRSAVTFWLPNCGSFTAWDLCNVFDTAAALCAGVGEERDKKRSGTSGNGQRNPNRPAAPEGGGAGE